MRIRLSVLLLATAFLTVTPAWANKQVFDKTIHSTCWIVVTKADGHTCLGTGWLADKQRKQIITSYHVVAEAESVAVYFPLLREGTVVFQPAAYRKNSIHGRVVRTDSKRDLALVELSYLPPGVKELPLARSEPAVGQAVYGIGNSSMTTLSIGTLWKMRQGVITKIGFRAYLQSLTTAKAECRIVVSDCGIRGGDSGGPLVNAQGELVGVGAAYKAETGECISIHIAEVEEFLRRAQVKSLSQSASPVEGPWTLKWRAKSQDVYAGVIFKANSTLVFEGPAKIFAGTFRLVDGELEWNIPGMNIRQKVAITFGDANSFHFISENVRFTCTRR